MRVSLKESQKSFLLNDADISQLYPIIVIELAVSKEKIDYSQTDVCWRLCSDLALAWGMSAGVSTFGNSEKLSIDRIYLQHPFFVYYLSKRGFKTSEFVDTSVINTANHGIHFLTSIIKNINSIDLLFFVKDALKSSDWTCVRNLL